MAELIAFMASTSILVLLIVFIYALDQRLVVLPNLVVLLLVNGSRFPLTLILVTLKSCM